MTAKIIGVGLGSHLWGSMCVGLTFRGAVTPLLLPRISRSHGPCSEMLFLAEDCAGHLVYQDTRKHVLCIEWHPSLESPVDHVGAHQSDGRMAVFGCGELMSLYEQSRKRAPFV